jgi:hypothetical protein
MFVKKNGPRVFARVDKSKGSAEQLARIALLIRPDVV